VLIVDSRGVKRHVVGKKYIRHYAADRVLASFRDASELLCLRLHQNTSRRVETQTSTVSLWTIMPVSRASPLPHGGKWAGSRD